MDDPAGDPALAEDGDHHRRIAAGLDRQRVRNDELVRVHGGPQAGVVASAAREPGEPCRSIRAGRRRTGRVPREADPRQLARLPRPHDVDPHARDGPAVTGDRADGHGPRAVELQGEFGRQVSELGRRPGTKVLVVVEPDAILEGGHGGDRQVGQHAEAGDALRVGLPRLAAPGVRDQDRRVRDRSAGRVGHADDQRPQRPPQGNQDRLGAGARGRGLDVRDPDPTPEPRPEDLLDADRGAIAPHGETSHRDRIIHLRPGPRSRRKGSSTDRQNHRHADIVDDLAALSVEPVVDGLRSGLPGGLRRFLRGGLGPDGRRGDGGRGQEGRGGEGQPSVRLCHRRPPRVEDPRHAVFQSPSRIEQPDDRRPAAPRARRLRQLQEQPRVAARVAAAEDEVVARLLAGPRQPVIEPVDQRVRPEDDRRGPLEQADEPVAADRVRGLVDEDVAQSSKGLIRSISPLGRMTAGRITPAVTGPMRSEPASRTGGMPRCPVPSRTSPTHPDRRSVD